MSRLHMLSIAIVTVSDLYALYLFYTGALSFGGGFKPALCFAVACLILSTLMVIFWKRILS